MRLFIAIAAIAILMIGGGTTAAEDPPVLAPRAILKEHAKAVWCVAFSPDGKLLVSGGGNLIVGENNPGELILWNPMTGKRIATLPSQGGRVRALAFSPDGKILAAGYEPENIIGSGQTVLWSLPAKTPKGKTPFETHSLAFSKDGKFLALGGVEPPPPQGGGSSSGGIKVWDVRQSLQTTSMAGNRRSIDIVAFSPDGRTITSGSGDGTAMLWDAQTGKLTMNLPVKLGPNPSMAFSPDGTKLAMGTKNDMGQNIADVVTFLDLKTEKILLKIALSTKNYDTNINTLAFSHDGKTLAVGTGWASDGGAILLDPADGKRIATLRGHVGPVQEVCFSADDKTLATGSIDKTVMLWDVSAKGIAESSRKLPEPPTGKTTPAKPPADKLPEAPVGNTPPVELPSGKFPESVIKFHKSMESLRKLETVRLEKRLEALREAVRLGAKDPKNPVAKEATVLMRDLGTRLKLVKSGKPYVPRLFPKYFAIGQIGELDDDLRLTSRTDEAGVARISVSFEELGYLTGQPGIWSRNTHGADSFYVRATFADDLPSPARDNDRNSPTNRLLKSHVYEVVEGKKRGAVTEYVLTPFKMDEVQVWLKAEEKRPKK